jgi:hypothetical protein
MSILYNYEGTSLAFNLMNFNTFWLKVNTVKCLSVDKNSNAVNLLSPNAQQSLFPVTSALKKMALLNSYSQ